jgi:hypothetical protein
MDISKDPGVWVAAFATLGIYSFLWRDNKWYKTIECAFIGLGGAMALVLGYQNVRDLAVVPLFEGNLLALVPILLGLALFARYSKDFVWLSRVPLGFIYGLGAGVGISGIIQSQFLGQIASTILAPTSFDDVVIFLSVLFTVSYFLFSFGDYKGAGIINRSGRIVMMISFGATFGNTVMGRMSTLISRLSFLYGDWLGLLK